MIVHGFPICPFTQRVRAALALKGLAHRAEYDSLAEPSSAFLALSPSGEGPVLQVEGGVVVGSGPILEYLEESFSHRPLFPSAPLARGEVRSWVDVADRAYRAQCLFQRAGGVVLMERRQAQLAPLLARAEAALEATRAPCFGGEAPSAVDALWYPVLHRAQLVRAHTDHDVLEAFPRLASLRAHLLAVEPLADTVPEGFEGHFVDFYLSSLTHLGRMMLVRRGRSGVSRPETAEDDPLLRCR